MRARVGGPQGYDGECWTSCTEKGRRSSAIELGAAATTFTLCFMKLASRPGGRATASRSAAAGGSATSAHGLLGGNGGSDAAGAAAAWLASQCDAGAHSPSCQQRQVDAAP